MANLYTNFFYNTYSKNIYSQNGEDGIIEELLKRLNINNGWVCEFGAWDGIYLSNTFNLVKKGFNAVFIEGDINKYNDLLKTVNEHDNIIPINAFVDYNDTQNSLDNLLNKTNIPIDFDILSIDVDSYDYQIWKSLKKYKPKIVIIEINSSVNTKNNYHIHDSDRYSGTGFKPTFDLGIEKGYKFVLHTGNMFFIRSDLFDKLNIHYDNPLENFRTCWGSS
jgi:hydroxymethylpyrimidine pyrophosphatase-like HAD family hydrolase